MKRSVDRILTSHAGALHLSKWGPRSLMAEPLSSDQVERRVGEIVEKQVEVGIDIINNGEVTHGVSFVNTPAIMTGIEMREIEPGKSYVRGLPDKDMEDFGAYYDQFGFANPPAEPNGTRLMLPPVRKVVTGPITSKSTELFERDIATLKAATAGLDVADVFICILSPGWIDRTTYNEFYRNDEEYLFALAEAIRPFYKTVTDAGLILQLDDPNLVDCWTWERMNSLDEYHRFIDIRIDAMNSVIRDLPEEQIRLHVCWGSWPGPHTGALPLKDAIDRIYRVHAQCFSIEAAKANHSHEWKIFKEFKLPEGKIIMPGVVDHTTAVVEHPEAIADKLIAYANLVGRENVMAGTDCGFRQEADVNWAKYEAMVEGARLASRQLWRRS